MVKLAKSIVLCVAIIFATSCAKQEVSDPQPQSVTTKTGKGLEKASTQSWSYSLSNTLNQDSRCFTIYSQTFTVGAWNYGNEQLVIEVYKKSSSACSADTYLGSMTVNPFLGYCPTQTFTYPTSFYYYGYIYVKIRRGSYRGTCYGSVLVIS
jgi:hypothetical protein